MSASHLPDAHVLSVTEAAAKGVPALLRQAERGEGVVVARRGVPVACLVSMDRLREMDDLEADLRDTALVLARMLGDTGTRLELDDAITALGFDRSDLERELAAQIATDVE